jgi:K+-transporting ATPase ATPase A chain
VSATDVPNAEPSPTTDGGEESPGGRAVTRPREILLPGLLAVAVLTLLTGVAFPLVLALLARLLFPHQADGSLIERDGVVVGSELIGQDFRQPGYFHPRPSAAGTGYDGTASGGTNLGPGDPKLLEGAADDPATPNIDESFAGIRQLADAYRRINGISADTAVPIDAVTRSGSGLDPHISPFNAELQVQRVARERKFDEGQLRALVAEHTRGRQLGVLGEPRVAVLPLNLALDRGRLPTVEGDAGLPASPPSPTECGLWRWLEFAVFLGIVLALVRPVGLYLAQVFEGRATFLDPALQPVERLLYRLLCVRPEREMTAGVYTACFLVFGLLGAAFLFALLVVQHLLPGGPDSRHLTVPLTTDLTANTAMSFATTTTWQAYAGETTLRYITQIVGLASQNFLGGAASLAVGLAFIRGLARERSATVGNFWVDVVRAILWVLVPLSLVGGIVLVWQGVPLNLSPYTEVQTLEGTSQTIAQGPVAALEVIKNLGSNGGGFFNANGAHPYETPTPLANLLHLLAIVVLPASLTVTFGQVAGRPRAGFVLLGVMVVLFVAGLAVCDRAEQTPPRYLAGLGVQGGNMEGKETRFGVGGSVLAAVVTSNGATGSNNSMHGSYHPLSVLVLLVNMLMGEVVFGGLGTGLYSMVMVALVAVFMGGLMVGRTPEYLGKTVGIAEAKLVALYALLTPVVVLTLTGLACATAAGRAGMSTQGPHGFTEALFAYASCAANNGQAMAGLSANSPFYNATTVAAMVAGRFGLAALALALAGRLAAQVRRPTTVGTLPCDTATFAVLVLGAVLLLGALCFLPALTLGPVAEWLRPAGGAR